ASVFVGYLDFTTGEMRFASGGHNPPLLYRAETQSFELLKAKGILLGVLEEVNFEEGVVQVQQDDVIVMYTDGVTEAMTPENEEFGMERLKRVISDHANVRAIDLGQKILVQLASFSGERGAFDDETMVIIKRQS